MTQTQQKIVAENLFPFSKVENLTDLLTQEKPARVSNTNEGSMPLPVNNYLKTPDEIEMEFRYGINPRKLNLRRDNLHDVASIMKTDGYLNIHNLDEALSGFMEENY